ncbi:granzyme G-like [Chanos chanos]|uniref:trypsin n=1 Tax=Chanos chanos TaxID=29144 RepID=A0A6J2W7H6_CHACN|nr:granzyme G-like [Chanos chanos]
MANTPLLLLVTALPALTLSASVNEGIINGREAKPHSRPYMVSVQISKGHICGGFLVSKSFVMTAAHCSENAQNLKVVLGAHDLSAKDNLGPVTVKKYHRHPNFEPKTFMNDIMLLELENKVQLSKRVQLIPLPKPDGHVKAGTVCSVAGWGYTRPDGHPSMRLQEANLTVFNEAECKRLWTQHDGEGDSGGPLVCGDKAVGVSSFGQKCTNAALPEVYTNISAFLPWINKIIG